MKLLQIILAFFLPPVAVAMNSGISKTFWLNLVLTLLVFIPGVIHALIVIV